MSMNGKKTILLVEDESIIAMASADSLHKYGYRVVVAHSGEKAADLAVGDLSIDLVLMDIDLGPGIDGTEAARRILKQRDLPVLFLSSHTEAEIVEKTEKITSYGYVVKNSGDTVLLASIRMAFRLYDAHLREKEKELALVQERENLGSILAASPVAMLVVDDGFDVDYGNPAAKDLFGVIGRAAWGGRCGDFFLCENRSTDPRGCGYSENCDSCAVYLALGKCLAAGDEPVEMSGETCLRLTSPRGLMWIRYRVRSLVQDGRNKAIMAVEDITERMREKRSLERLVLIAEKFLQSDTPEVDYQLITDSLVDISGAKYAVFNLYDPDEAFLVTKAISGVGDHLKKAASILGYPLTGKRWPSDAALAEKIGDRVIIRFPSLLDVTGKVLPRSAVSLLMRTFDIGETVVIKILVGGHLFGDFILIMLRDESFRNDGIVEVYARQVGLLLARKNVEQSLESAAHDKETLLRELQHRVKNNLAMIASLIHIEAGRTENPDALGVLKNLEGRIMVLANLYGHLNEEGTAEIRLDFYLRKICDALSSIFDEERPGEGRIKMVRRFDEVTAEPRQASSFGLILNELVTNAYKHAFPGDRRGSIDVDLRSGEKALELTVADDGVGLPGDFDPDRGTGFGFKLAGMLANQMGGSLERENGRGTVVRVRIPHR